jgi:hypothetical protein
MRMPPVHGGRSLTQRPIAALFVPDLCTRAYVVCVWWMCSVGVVALLVCVYVCVGCVYVYVYVYVYV